MIPLKRLFLPAAALMAMPLSSCVVPPPRAPGPHVAVTTDGIGVYDTLPRGFASPYYLFGNRYYYGGRWETGRFTHRGRAYDGRYFHNGRYIYGGRFNNGPRASAPAARGAGPAAVRPGPAVPGGRPARR